MAAVPAQMHWTIVAALQVYLVESPATRLPCEARGDSDGIQDLVCYQLRPSAGLHAVRPVAADPAEIVVGPCLCFQIVLADYNSADQTPCSHLDSSATSCNSAYPAVAHSAAVVDLESSCSDPSGAKLVSHSLIAGMATVAGCRCSALVEEVAGAAEKAEAVEAAATVAVAAEDCRCGPAAVAAVGMLEVGPAGLDLDAAGNWNSFEDAAVGHQPAASLPASS